jgi:hypothetical protein
MAEEGENLFLCCYETNGDTAATLRIGFLQQKWRGRFRLLEIKTLRVPLNRNEIQEVNPLERQRAATSPASRQTTDRPMLNANSKMIGVIPLQTGSGILAYHRDFFPNSDISPDLARSARTSAPLRIHSFSLFQSQSKNRMVHRSGSKR